MIMNLSAWTGRNMVEVNEWCVTQLGRGGSCQMEQQQNSGLESDRTPTLGAPESQNPF